MSQAVTTISAKPKTRPLRVGAYCRVSSEADEQTMSFESQIVYYRTIIEENPDWELAGIYAEQSTGTDFENRSEYIRMVTSNGASRETLFSYNEEGQITFGHPFLLSDSQTIETENGVLTVKSLPHLDSFPFAWAPDGKICATVHCEILRGIFIEKYRLISKFTRSNGLSCSYSRGKEWNNILCLPGSRSSSADRD